MCFEIDVFCFPIFTTFFVKIACTYLLGHGKMAFPWQLAISPWKNTSPWPNTLALTKFLIIT